MNGDTITIQSIHPEAKQMVVVFNIEGTTYPKVLPFFTDQDATLLTQQLQSFAQELKGEFDALKATVLAANAGTVPTPTDAVTALVGTPIPVEVAPATTPAPASGTPAETTAPAPAESGTPATPAPAETPASPTPTDASTTGEATTTTVETTAPAPTAPADTTGTPTA